MQVLAQATTKLHQTSASADVNRQTLADVSGRTTALTHQQAQISELKTHTNLVLIRAELGQEVLIIVRARSPN